MTVRISIVTPSFNQAPFLERTLRSVLAQRDLVHEYFVLDGGSSDGSREIIERQANEGIDFWISEPDGGQAAAIHRGFTMAMGDVLYWLNSDDVLLPGALQRVHEAFAARPEIGVLTGWGVIIDAEDRIVRMPRRPHDSPRWARFGYMRVHQPCCFFRREVYERAGGLDPTLHCMLDSDLWYRMLGCGATWAGVKAFLAALRMHGETKGATLHEQYRHERQLMKRRHPWYTRNRLNHALGRVAYYTSQATSGRAWSSWRDESRFRGRTLEQVFADAHRRRITTSM